ncbi:hypothetical protein HK100_010102, partial [Physocladia obscura]
QQELNQVTPDNQTTPLSQQVGNPLFTLLNPGVDYYCILTTKFSIDQLPSRDVNGKFPLPHDHLTARYRVIQRLDRGSFADVFKVLLLHQRRRTRSGLSQPLTSVPTGAAPNGKLQVNPATDNNNAEYYAVKKPRVAITGAKDRRARLEELVIMDRLAESGDVSHIIEIREAWEQYGCLYFVMEFCAKGTFLEYMDSKNSVEEVGGGGLRSL